MRSFIFVALVGLLAACSSPKTRSIGITKADFAGGKADELTTQIFCKYLGYPKDCDVCEAAGWYEDEDCDTFCANPDPDCLGVADGGVVIVVTEESCTAIQNDVASCLAGLDGGATTVAEAPECGRHPRDVTYPEGDACCDQFSLACSALIPPTPTEVDNFIDNLAGPISDKIEPGDSGYIVSVEHGQLPADVITTTNTFIDGWMADKQARGRDKDTIVIAGEGDFSISWNGFNAGYVVSLEETIDDPDWTASGTYLFVTFDGRLVTTTHWKQ